MTVHRFTDTGDLMQMARAFLMQDEARHNLIFGITSRLEKDPQAFSGFQSWVVVSDDRPVAVAFMTPPFPLAISRIANDSAHDELAAALMEDGVTASGLVGAKPEVDDFVLAWERHGGPKARVHMAQRIYQLEHLRPVTGVPGERRRAGDEDRALVTQWLNAFIAESGASGDADSMVERQLKDREGGLFVWEDNGKPVSVGGCGGKTPNGMRVGPVYTPPDKRGNGYASALVAQMSGSILERGSRFCFLYTDAANLASNAIYQRMGYEVVCDAVHYSFD